MAIHYLNLSRAGFLNDFKRLYHYTTLDRMSEVLQRQQLTFVNPTLWADPFERFYLDRQYKMGDDVKELPIKNRAFALCFSGTGSSEAYWKVYAPKEDGVRLTIKAEVLLSEFLEKISNAEVYIGRVTYQNTREFHALGIDKAALIREIVEGMVGEQQIQLMLKKRKTFMYEDEIRIIVVPHQQPKDELLMRLSADITAFTQDFTLDPRLGPHHVAVLRDYYQKQFGFKVSHSRLYHSAQRGPIVLE